MIDLLKKYQFEHGELVISTLIAFLLPIYQKPIVLLISFLALNAFISWFTRGVSKLDKRFWPFILLFALYLIGLIFTSNFDYGLKDIESRSAFLLLPLFFGLSKRSKPINLGPIFVALISGSLVAICFCYYYAYECYETFNYVECFQGSRLAFNMHPTYFSLYLITGSAFFILWSISKKNKLLIIISILIGTGFLIMVYRLYSLGPIISLIGMLVALLFGVSYIQKKLKWFFIGCIGLLGIGFLAISTLPFLQKDINEVKTEFSNFYADREQYIIDNQSDPHSINARLIIWSESINFIVNHPFGVGTGDSMDELWKHYREKGLNVYADKKLNPHSQFLQTSVAIGIVPGILFLLTFLYYLKLSLQRKNLYLLTLTSLFFVACFFESVLERQWGILFFIFFLCLTLTHLKNPQSKLQKEE